MWFESFWKFWSRAYISSFASYRSNYLYSWISISFSFDRTISFVHGHSHGVFFFSRFYVLEITTKKAQKKLNRFLSLFTFCFGFLFLFRFYYYLYVWGQWPYKTILIYMKKSVHCAVLRCAVPCWTLHCCERAPFEKDVCSLCTAGTLKSSTHSLYSSNGLWWRFRCCIIGCIYIYYT